MSLVNLLSTGRSLIGLKDQPSKYMMRQENLLPKFGSEAGVTSTGDLPKTERAPAQPRVFWRRLSRVMAALCFWRRSKETLLGAGLRVRSTVRVEPQRTDAEGVRQKRTLEQVKVIRNDLQDAEFEIVVRNDKRTGSPFATRPGQQVESPVQQSLELAVEQKA